MKAFLLGGLMVLLTVWPVRADTVDLEPVSCAQFKTAYDTLSGQSFSAEDGSLGVAVNAIADNHMLLNKIQTEYMTGEQISAYLSGLKPIDALIWLQSVYTAIELQLKICSGGSYEQKRLVLIAPKLAPEKPGTKSCGGPMPDLSKPLK